MRPRHRLDTDYRQAGALLRDDLVWSGDFENIRVELLELIERYIEIELYPENITAIVRKLIAEENDLSI